MAMAGGGDGAEELGFGIDTNAADVLTWAAWQSGQVELMGREDGDGGVML
jgi:hypothetical protein